MSTYFVGHMVVTLEHVSHQTNKLDTSPDYTTMETSEYIVCVQVVL